MRKFLFILPLALVVAGGAFYLYVNNRAQAAIDARLEQMVAEGAYTSASYEDMRVHLNGDVSLTNLHLGNATGEFILQNIEVSDVDYAHETPWHLQVSINGVQLPAGLPEIGITQNAALEQFLEQMAQDGTLPLELTYRYNYEPANDYQIDSDVALALDQAFALTARSTSRGVPLENFGELQAQGNDPQAAQALLLQQLQDMSVPSTYLSFEDRGIVDALLAISAAESGVSPEQLRTMLMTQARSLYLFVPEDVHDYAMNSGIELATFLEGGKSLTLNLEPMHDGNLGQLQQEIMTSILTGNFARIVDLLNLQISTQ